MDTEAKILVIGIDGATFDLIKPWIAQGKLPTLSRLMREGAFGNLSSVPNTNSAPAWVSFATGDNPGKHGIFYFDEPVFGTYQRRYVNASFRKSRALWDYASAAGKRVGVINVPITYPAEKVNGFMIAGIDTPRTWCKGFTYPQELAKELHTLVSDYEIESDSPHLIKLGKKDLAAKSLIKALEKRETAAKYFMERYPWDVFIVVFTAVDAAQHFFWKDMESARPVNEGDEAPDFSAFILQVYQRADRAIASLIEQARDSWIMLVSDHGGGFNQRGAEFINPWLAGSGFLKFKDSTLLKRLFTPNLKFMYDIIDRGFPRKTKQKLVKIFPGVREKVEAATCYQNIDWSGTIAFNDGARDEIWINLRGREPEGIVTPGAEYEKTRDQLIESLLKCVDIKTGKPAVERVFRREAIYSGKYIEKAPDIFVQWQQNFVMSGLQNPGGVETLKHPSRMPLGPPLCSGGHRKDGIFLLHGPSSKRNFELHSASIMDVTPTLLYLLGLPIPEEMDGRVLEDAFEDHFLKQNPPTYREGGTELEGVKEEDFSREDAEKVREKLKGMGYID